MHEQPRHVAEPGPVGAITGGVWPAVAAGVGAAVVCVALWMGVFGLLRGTLLAPPLTGLLVGGAVRLFKPAFEKVTWLAVGLTFLACFTGYVLVDLYQYPWSLPRSFAQASRGYFSDLVMMALTAMGCYIAYALARPGYATKPTPGV